MKAKIFSIALTMALLSGCGGGGGSSSQVPPGDTDPDQPYSEMSLERVATVINATSAHNAGYDGAGVLVAVVDTGIRATHTVFSSADLRLTDGWNFVEDDADLSDLNGHGTGVSSIIVGSGDVRGIAPGSSLLPVRAGNEDAVFEPVAMMDAVSHAAAKGAKIINMSFEVNAELQTPAWLDGIASSGVIGIIGAGNDGLSNPYHSELFDQDGFLDVSAASEGHFLAVGATTIDGTSLATYSNRAGVMKDRFIVAPAGFMVADPSSDTAQSFGVGTSFATPIVSAAAALVWQANPSLTPTEVTGILCSTAKDMGEPGNDVIYGCGLLDVDAAVDAALAAGG